MFSRASWFVRRRQAGGGGQGRSPRRGRCAAYASHREAVPIIAVRSAFVSMVVSSGVQTAVGIADFIIMGKATAIVVIAITIIMAICCCSDKMGP